MDNITENTDKLAGYADTAIEAAIVYGPKLVLAIVTLIIGLWIIKRIVGKVEHHFASKADPTLAGFMSSLTSVLLKMMLWIKEDLMIL